MSSIYRPQGRAGEYSPYALNLFKACSHGCEYCYVPRMMRPRDKDYDHTAVRLQNVTRESIRKDFAKHARLPEQVFLSFTTDPYMHNFDTSLTTFAVEQALEFEIPIAVLTKAPTNAIKDFHLMTNFRESLIFGTTLTTMRNFKEAEPFADDPLQRISAVWKTKKLGIRTWLSMEPAYSIGEALEIIEQTQSVFDHYKLGKMNYRKLDVGWAQYLVETVTLLRSLGKSFYIKNDLAAFAPVGFFSADERNPRLFDAQPFKSHRIAA